MEGRTLIKLSNSHPDRTTRGKAYKLVRNKQTLHIIDDNGDKMVPSVLNITTWKVADTPLDILWSKLLWRK